jgi:hypothetical protein
LQNVLDHPLIYRNLNKDLKDIASSVPSASSGASVASTHFNINEIAVTTHPQKKIMVSTFKNRDFVKYKPKKHRKTNSFINVVKLGKHVSSTSVEPHLVRPSTESPRFGTRKPASKNKEMQRLRRSSTLGETFYDKFKIKIVFCLLE